MSNRNFSTRVPPMRCFLTALPVVSAAGCAPVDGEEPECNIVISPPNDAHPPPNHAWPPNDAYLQHSINSLMSIR